MKQLIKIGLAILGTLVALVVIAVIVLPLVIDPNDYKGEITSVVERQTGRQLSIPGDIELSVFPWLGAEIGAASLANAKGFGGKPFAEIQSADIRVKLLPLLAKRIEIGTVKLDGLRLHLARNARGHTNWEDLIKATAARKQPPETEQPAAKTANGMTLSALEIGGIEVDNAAVSWNDVIAGEHYDLSHFNLSTGRLAAGEPFPLNAAFQLAADKLGLTTKTKLSADIQADPVRRIYHVGNLSLEVRAEGKALPGGAQQAKLTGNADADLQSGLFKVTELVLRSAGITVTGHVNGKSLNAKPHFDGQLTVHEFNPRSVMQQLAIEPPATRDGNALTKASLDTHFEATPARATLKQLVIELDDSRLEGEASLADFSKPAAAFHLALDHIDLDRYRSPTSGGEEATAKQQTSANTTTDGEINLTALKNLKLDGRISAQRIIASNLKIDDAELAVTARNGVLRIQPLAAKLYHGNMHLQSRVDAAGKRPSYALKGNLEGLQFGPLLEDLIGSGKLDGLANLSVDLTTAGNTAAAMRRSLSGTVTFQVLDGAFSKFDLAQLLQTARARFLGIRPTATGGAKTQTPFSRLGATFSVADGVFSSHDLSLESKAIAAIGAGNYNLLANQLDYTIKASVPPDAGGTLKELRNLTIPIKLSGSLFSPDYHIDIASAIKGAAQQRLHKETSKLREKAQQQGKKLDEKLQNKIQQKLQNLFDDQKD